MSLGIKQLSVDPWTDITKKYPVGSKHNGEVKNFTNFGVFIELEEGIDGLVYISDLSWIKKIKHPSEVLSLNDKIDVIVLELDIEGRKLSLGYKQTKENPWLRYEKEFSIDSVHRGKIFSIIDKGSTVKFNDEITAFIPSKYMFKEDGSKLKKGDEEDFMIIEFSKEFKRVVGSHSHIFKQKETKNLNAKKSERKGSKSEKTKLGDIEELANLKERLDDKN